MAKGQQEDLLGLGSGGRPGAGLFEEPCAAPGPVPFGRTVDLSGAPTPLRPPEPRSSGGGYGGGGPGPSSSRGPSSIEGGGPGLSLSSFSPAHIMREMATKPVSQIVADQGRQLLSLPRIAARTYQAAASRYLRPWTEFARLRPGQIVEGFRNASRRGEVQIYLQRNVLSNAQRYLPNYMFIFLAMLFCFVCTSPMLLMMLTGVGGGWGHAMRSDDFRNKPWMLTMGGMRVPLGSNAKTALLSLPTLLVLHFFMGPVLWSAALCTGGVSLAHAALKDRDEHSDDDDSRRGRAHESP